MSEENNNTVWATVALMGHVEMAGRLSKPTDWGGLFQVDVPDGESFTTKLFSPQSVYAIDIVSEPIARAYAKRARQIVAYDAPIVTREEHQAAIDRAQQEIYRLGEKTRELERRLTAVNALPAPKPESPDGNDSFDTDTAL